MSTPDKDTLEHMKMIQGVITRLAGNSFTLKNWCITLVVAVMGFAAKERNVDERLVLVAFVPALIFWGLDGYYLWQERRFRALFDAVRARTPAIDPYSMNTKPVTGGGSWLGATFSKTLLFLYGTLLVALVVVVLVVEPAATVSVTP
ncbi:MAG TPA: hypothetical protein VFX98_19575 [Longimicrobiaceae bacterium]|nr:hypothetical protein [Longimicrobiaceae bacterium]